MPALRTNPPTQAHAPTDGMVTFDLPSRPDLHCSQAAWTSSREFSELVQWCNNFAGALQSVIAVLLDDMAKIKGVSHEMADQAIAPNPQIDTELQSILNIVDQVHDIVTRIDRVARRAAIGAQPAGQN